MLLDSILQYLANRAQDTDTIVVSVWLDVVKLRFVMDRIACY